MKSARNKQRLASPAVGGNGHPCSPEFRVQTILVPVDFSQCSVRAVDYALGLAELSKAKLVLLHVIEPSPYPGLGFPAQSEDSNHNLLEVSRGRLEGIRRSHVGGRARTECVVRIGRPPSEIPETARALGADLIVIATRGIPDSKPVLLGSTAERVVRHSRCPVLTVPCK